MLHKIITTGYIILITALMIGGGVLCFNFYQAQAVTAVYSLSGWLWTETYGWISLNSENAALLDRGASYKVTLEANKLSGWAWSENVGWICVGETCQSTAADICNNQTSCNPDDFGTEVPPAGWSATINSSNNQIQGWAKILSLKDNGWISLGKSTSVPVDDGVYCYDCVYDTSTPPVLTDCNTCFTNVKFDAQNIPAEADTVIGGSGKICSSCTNCTSTISDISNISRDTCNSCGNCRQYGGALDSTTGGLVGWGWNGNSDSDGNLTNEGAGWIQLSAGSGVVYPWLETVYGAVFSNRDVRQKNFSAKVNATYCIYAQSVDNFTSKNCAKNSAANITGINIKFPTSTPDFSYQNALGRLDLTGLTTVAKTVNKIAYNKYGNVVTIDEASTTLNSAINLNNSVYLVKGDLTLDDGLELKNGSNENGGSRGNGLVIIEGNLIINSDFSYDSALIADSDLKKLASVAWIVKGDVIVNPNVKKVVGAFMVLGRSDATCSYEDNTACNATVDYPKYKSTGYGIFFSQASGNQLAVYGLLFAKAFDFRRTYASALQGAERIIYDGRLIANPPPGMKSFFEGLPVIRDFQF